VNETYREMYSRVFSRINLEKVLKHYDIEYRAARGKRGKEFISCCPFHNDMTPSFSISETSGLYNCFVCGGGDFFKFVKNIEKLKSLKEAIEFVKGQVGLSDTFDAFSVVESSTKVFETKSEEIIDEHVEFKEVRLPPCEPAENYFDIVKKRVDLESIKTWGMKYCVNDRIFHERLIIPIYLENKLVSFAARDMSGKAEIWGKIKEILKKKKLTKKEKQNFIDKYLYKKILYPFGTQLGKLFFNWDEAIKHKEVVICEGIFDAIRIIKFGYNALALLTCHLNSYKTELLINKFDRIYIALDNDDKVDELGNRKNPGQESAEKILKEYLTDIQTYNVVLPLGKDPDDCNKDEFDEAMSDATKLKKLFTLS